MENIKTHVRQDHAYSHAHAITLARLHVLPHIALSPHLHPSNLEYTPGRFKLLLGNVQLVSVEEWVIGGIIPHSHFPHFTSHSQTTQTHPRTSTLPTHLVVSTHSHVPYAPGCFELLLGHIQLISVERQVIELLRLEHGKGLQQSSY